jgi:hypothetical protein
VLAYRVRISADDVAQTVIAQSADGEQFATEAVLDRERFGAMSMERPAVVRLADGRWRLYVCCATPGSKHWWIDALEADDPAGFAQTEARAVFTGDERVGVKDPVIRRTGDSWQAWICCHPLDEPGEEDRMTTAYATSRDGLVWDWRGTALAGRIGHWDARGARVTAVLPDGSACYDGRATKEQNFAERTGLARATGPGRLAALGDAPVSDVRYLDVLPLGDGSFRLFYEAPLPDGSHELRTEVVSV